MFVRVESVTERVVNVTILDIDDYDVVIPIGVREFLVEDDTVLETLKNSTHAAVFTGNNDEIIILASGISKDELNKEKTKTMNSVDRSKEKNLY
jgi:hypothetical protein